MRPLSGALAALLIAPLAATCAPAPAPPPAPLSSWAGVVVSGDDHASHTELLSETFDNARRDVAAGFERRGVGAGPLLQFSVDPAHHSQSIVSLSEINGVEAALETAHAHAPGGCLIYLTSHGSPGGVVVGRALVPPAHLARDINQACGAAPTAVIVSACFSGVFVPALKGPNRFILTAARRDRSSFGCGESDKYPFFDGCVIEALPTARDFADLGRRVQACVAKREDEQNLRPRSEPQMFVGPGFAAAVPPFDAPR